MKPPFGVVLSFRQSLNGISHKKVINRYFVCFPSFLLMVLRDWVMLCFSCIFVRFSLFFIIWWLGLSLFSLFKGGNRYEAIEQLRDRSIRISTRSISFNKNAWHQKKGINRDYPCQKLTLLNLLILFSWLGAFIRYR